MWSGIHAVLVEVVLVGAAVAAVVQWVIRPAIRVTVQTVRAVNYIAEEMRFDSGTTARDAIERLEKVNMLMADHLGIEIPEHLMPHHDADKEQQRD